MTDEKETNHADARSLSNAGLDSATLRLIDDLASDNEVRVLIAIHFFRAEKAKRLMRDAGFGVTGTDILETAKQVLMEVSNEQN